MTGVQTCALPILSKASKALGVVRILTGDDLAKDKIGGLIAGWKIVSQDGKDMKCPPHPPLAKDSVNFVGDHVAVVIAETLEEAKNAAELVNVSYKIKKAVINAADATSFERSEEHTSELQSRTNLVCRLLLEKKKHRSEERV